MARITVIRTPLAFDATASPVETRVGDLASGPTVSDAELRPLPVRTATSGPARGAVLDRFMVLGPLGEGGMGVVIAAYDPHLDRKVALKLVRYAQDGGRASEVARARLLREARAMAKLSHPNVITVHEVGTVDGQVFVAMECVEGQTLARWLSGQRRSWRDVVDVFVQAGRGLAAAHAAGLVHRDFKPDNVLIANDGRVLVTDFGLAASSARAATTSDRSGRDVGDGSGSIDTLTRTGSILGTPGYMAPEQHAGDVVGPAADQFAFCVALWEGLCGERPFDGDTYPSLAHNVLSGEIRSSSRAAAIPRWLRDVLLRGLRVAPEARFAGMAQLLDRLQRDPATKRKRIAALVGFATLALVAIGGYARDRAGGEGAMCAVAADHLKGVWDDDTRREIRAAFRASGRPYAEHTYQRVETLLDKRASQWIAMRTEACEATQLRGEQSAELMDLRMLCLDRRLADLRALVTDLSRGGDASVVDHAITATLHLDPIEACADTAALRAVVPPPSDPEKRARVAEGRRRLSEAHAHFQMGKYSVGTESATRARDEIADLDYAPLQAEAAFAVGLLRSRDGDPEAAERALLAAASAAAAAGDDDLLARTWVQLAWVNGFLRARYDRAATIGELAEVAVARARGGASLRSDLSNILGVVYASRGDLEAARRHFEQARAIGERELGVDHPDTANSIDNLGILYAQQARYSEALEHHELALAIRERVLGADHPDTANSRNGLGQALLGAGRVEDARLCHERALQARERVLGAEHFLTGESLNNLGEVTLRAGDPARAIVYFERALRLVEAQLGARHVEVARILRNLGQALIDAGRHVDGGARCRRAREIEEGTLEREHPAFLATSACLVRAAELSESHASL